jgi:iron complex transport system substrate-binding protein
LCLAAIILLGARPIPAAEIRVTDDLERPVVLAAPAKRVVALYGAMNEILAGMGLADRLVARTEADHEPAAIESLPVIGTHMRPNLERVLAVKPDLVLQVAGRDESRQTADELAGLGVPVAVFSIHDFPGLFAAIERIGTLTGQPEAASGLVASLRQRLDRVAAATGPDAAGKRPTVFFEARSGSLLTAGRGSMVDAVISAAGATNAVTQEKRLVRLADEELLRLAPDVCLTQRGPMNPEAKPMAERQDYAALPCVARGRAYVVDEATFSRPGPRSVEAVEQLARLLAAPAAKEARP